VPHDDDSDDDDESEEKPQQDDQSQSSESSSSSEDSNDSAAAAHAAAIGHSPQPVPTKLVVPTSKEDSSAKGEEGKVGEEAPKPSAAESDNAEENKPEQASNGEGTAELAKEVPAPMAISPPLDEHPQDPSADSAKGDSALVENGKMQTTPEQKIPKPKKKKIKFFCPPNLDERDNDENTAIHVAIHARRVDHVKLLVEAGASVHKKSDGSPPIHAAISMGSLAKHAEFAHDCVRVLDANGADLMGKDDAMHTPLYLACMYNIPEIVSYILSTEAGVATLNLRSDRSQGRALHAAAKFDTLSNAKGPAVAVAPGHPLIPQLPHHHPDGTVVKALHHIPGFPGKLEASGSSKPATPSPTSTQARVTQILLGTPGIEFDATNSVGQTALHVACSRGNWNVVRRLLQAGASPDIADRRGFTPGQCGHKRGMPIPNDLLEVLGGPPSSGTVAPPRDLIVDPNSSTLLLTHELCGLHRTCSPIRRDPNSDPPPENVRRLNVLVDEETGILRTGEFNRCTWENETRRAAMVDVLKVRANCPSHVI
jgi:ankyrin repeat protein